MPLATTAKYESAGDTETATVRATAQNSYANRSSYSFPIYIAASTDPMATVKCASCNIEGTWSNDTTSHFNVPSDAAASPGSDSSIVIVTADHKTVWESWQWSGSSPSYTTSYTVEQSLLGSGWGVGVHAAGCSLMGGLIRGWELASNPPLIPHTLSVGISTGAAKSPQIWPATSQDGSGSQYGGSIPMGTLIALDPKANVDSIAKTAEGKALGHALQDYGAYVIDTAGTTTGVGFVLDPETTTEAQANNVAGDLGALVAEMLVITNNTASTPGGGTTTSTRRAPMAPTLK